MSNSNPLLPLLVLSFLLLFAALIAYGIYVVATGVADQANKKMEQRHMSISKGGMVVGVREKGQERYVDQTQSFLVKAWNFSTWPAYKSRLWNKPPTEPQSRTPHSKPTSSSAHSKQKI